jgi:P4 family phage/plasmid primase-like protien
MVDTDLPIDSLGKDGLTKIPLAERLKTFQQGLIEHDKELEATQGKEYPYYPQFCDNPEKREGFKPARVAEWLSKNEHFKRDQETDILYYYDGKTWIPNGETYLEKILIKILQEENRTSHYNNILHVLKGSCCDRLTFSNKLATPNGLLDVETLELTENTPEEMPRFSIQTEYIKGSECLQWQEWLNQTMPNKEDQMTLQEWSGYILLPDYRFHKLLYNYGGGRNGKGTWERTIQAVIGLSNCSEVGLEEFDGNHRFALYQLYGKLFNSCSEPIVHKDYVLQTSIIKKVTGQDVISAERKGCDKRVEFPNTAKMTISANKFPKVEDTSIAFTERRLFLVWANQFLEGQGQIQYIEKNWLEGEHDERKGILCWMLEGLQRLLSNGKFSTSKTQQETELLFQRASDTIGAFVKETAQYGKMFAITRKAAKEAYENYCEFYGLKAENDRDFTSRLEQTAKISKGKISGERAWKGVTFKNLTEENQEEENKSLDSFGKGTEGTDGTLQTCSDTQTNPRCKIEQVENGVPSVPSVPDKLAVVSEPSGVKRLDLTDAGKAALEETFKGRLCSDECENWRNKECGPGTNVLFRPETAEIPKKCTNYKQKGVIEDGPERY